jgi:pyrimidine operon attenuation protein / uracil phosphoribosyltransferase
MSQPPTPAGAGRSSTGAAGPSSSGESRAVPAARQVLSEADVHRAIQRIAHEIVERNHGTQSLVLIGLLDGGQWFAERLASTVNELDHNTVPVGSLDVSFHRDDLNSRPVTPARLSSIPVDLTGRTVVLCDDVLFTGRTVRAALDALTTYGRPKSVQLAVVIDRGHRELPIRADYVGKNLPTALDEDVSATIDGVIIIRAEQP